MVTTNGNSVTLNGGGRAYLSNSSGNNVSATNNVGIDPNGFYMMPLLGYTLSFTVDNSKVHCSCNSALYFVGMPGYGDGQQPDPTSGNDYYCDANKVGGEYCPELDVSEANAYTIASTPHDCTSHNNKHW
jgi:hypothetical protein